MIVIGISGEARSGKDYFARTLQSYIGGTILRFGDAVKEKASLVFDIPEKELKDDDCKKRVYPITDTVSMTGREIFQKFGTDAMRSIVPDFWVYQLNEKLKQTKEDIVIIPDVRFFNEVMLVRSYPNIHYHIKYKRNIFEKIKRFFSFVHKSERLSCKYADKIITSRDERTMEYEAKYLKIIYKGTSYAKTRIK